MNTPLASGRARDRVKARFRVRATLKTPLASGAFSHALMRPCAC